MKYLDIIEKSASSFWQKSELAQKVMEKEDAIQYGVLRYLRQGPRKNPNITEEQHAGQLAKRGVRDAIITFIDRKRKNRPEIRYTDKIERFHVSDKTPLWDLFEVLPETEKKILEMRRAGYEYAEIAAKLDLTYNEVSKLILRAKRHLRNLYADSLS